MSGLKRINTDDQLKAMRKAWMRRGEGADGGLRAPHKEPDPPPRSVDAAQVRLGWYIPPRHVDDTFETFKPVTESQAAALDATLVWVDSVKAGEGGALALVGGTGTGKSHLLYAAVREVNLAGIHCAGFGWYDLADIRRNAKLGDEDAARKWERLLAARAFALDEIRPTSGSEFDATELSQLMTRAYRECQGVIVTSNHAGEKLSRIVGLAATSRLTEVVIIGPDMREATNRMRYLSA